MKFLESLFEWIGRITQIAIALVPLAIAFRILFGKGVPFVGNVVQNLIELLNNFAAQGVVGVIGLVIVIWLFAMIYKGRGNTTAQEQPAAPAGMDGA